MTTFPLWGTARQSLVETGGVVNLCTGEHMSWRLVAADAKTTFRRPVATKKYAHRTNSPLLFHRGCAGIQATYLRQPSRENACQEPLTLQTTDFQKTDQAMTQSASNNPSSCQQLWSHNPKHSCHTTP